jgi:hypothetical protein
VKKNQIPQNNNVAAELLPVSNSVVPVNAPNFPPRAARIFQEAC